MSFALKVLGAFLLAMAAFAALLFEGERQARALRPPAGVTTLAGFAEAMPPPRFMRAPLTDGRRWILWYGKSMSSMALPSGPPCYVFDDRGALVHWQPDTGDGGRADEFLANSTVRPDITLAEALEMTRVDK